MIRELIAAVRDKARPGFTLEVHIGPAGEYCCKGTLSTGEFLDKWRSQVGGAGLSWDDLCQAWIGIVHETGVTMVRMD